MRPLKKKITQGRERLCISMTATFLSGMAAHGYAFTHLTFSHDSLGGFYGTGIGKVSLGRWGVYVYKALTRELLTIPWLAGILCLVFIGLSVCLISEMLEMNGSWQIILSAAALVSNVTITSLIGTYIHDLEVDILALLMAVLAAYLWNDVRLGKRKRWYLLFGIGGGTISLSLYQSYISVTIVLIIAVLLFGLLEGGQTLRAVRQGLMGCVMLAGSALAYAVLTVVSLVASGISLRTGTYNSLLNMADSSFSISYRFLHTYQKWLEDFITNPISSSQGGRMGCANLLILLVFIALLFVKWCKTGPGEKILSVILLTLLPLAMNISCFLNGRVHDLMIYGIWMIYPLTITLTGRFCEEYTAKDSSGAINGEKISSGETSSGEIKRIGWILFRKIRKRTAGSIPTYFSESARYTVILLTAFIVFGNVQTSNTVYIKKETERQATLALMVRVLGAIEEQEGYMYGETEVAFIGLPFGDEETFYGYGAVSEITGVNRLSPISYQSIYGSYFTYFLNYDIQLCSGDVLSSLKEEEAVQSMSVFPNDGSVAVIDDIIVVKMSD